MAQERDDIMQWVANDEYFHNLIMRLYDKWTDDFVEGVFMESYAEKQAQAAIEEVAEALFAKGFWDSPYTEKEKREAVDEIMTDFEQYRDDEIASRKKIETAKPVPRPKMTPEDIEYTKRQEAMLVKIGIRQSPDAADMTEEDAKKAGVEYLTSHFMPASVERVRHALETGDQHLNTIKLRLWDDMAEKLGYRKYRMSLSDAVGVLKHVAKWYYA